MTRDQKPYTVFRRNGPVHLNRPVGSQFSRLLAAEECASAVVMFDTPCSELVWRVLATHSIRQFPLHFPSLRHRVPSHCDSSLPTHNRRYAHPYFPNAKYLLPFRFSEQLEYKLWNIRRVQSFFLLRCMSLPFKFLISRKKNWLFQSIASRQQKTCYPSTSNCWGGAYIYNRYSSDVEISSCIRYRMLKYFVRLGSYLTEHKKVPFINDAECSAVSSASFAYHRKINMSWIWKSVNS